MLSLKFSKMSEKFCLKWNDFHSNVSKSFGLFRNEEYLHDVTLVSDDYHQVSAHKLVLSACSEYFKIIFKNNTKPNAHPLLCLDGMTGNDLNNIMDYIYNGEVQIIQANLGRFISLARRLKLEGLMEDEDTDTQQDDPLEETHNVVENDNGIGVKEEISEASESVKAHKRYRRSKEMKKEKVEVQVSSENVDELERTIEQYIETDEDGKLKCTFCGKEAFGKNRGTARSNLGKHVETHLEGLSFSCHLCDKTFRSRHSLEVHRSRNHRTGVRITESM